MSKFILPLLLGMVGGLIGGVSADRYQSLFSPEPAATPVIVLNIDELIEREKDTGATDANAMTQGLKKAKTLAAQLKAQGYLVLTQGSIIDAPEALIVPQPTQTAG